MFPIIYKIGTGLNFRLNFDEDDTVAQDYSKWATALLDKHATQIVILFVVFVGTFFLLDRYEFLNKQIGEFPGLVVTFRLLLSVAAGLAAQRFVGWAAHEYDHWRDVKRRAAEALRDVEPKEAAILTVAYSEKLPKLFTGEAKQVLGARGMLLALYPNKTVAELERGLRRLYKSDFCYNAGDWGFDPFKDLGFHLNTVSAYSEELNRHARKYAKIAKEAYDEGYYHLEYKASAEAEAE